MKINLRETILLEMAKRGKVTGSTLFYDPYFKQTLTAGANKSNIHKWAGTPDGHTVHHEVQGGDHNYITKDSSGSAIHFSQFEHNRHKELPFEHTTQTIAGKEKTSTVGKNYVSNLALHHMEHTNIPLVSDADQTNSGHKMWHHITKTAMDKGHHVYHWDGNKLNKTTPENHDEHMKSSFGDTEAHTKRHMVVSPYSLEKK